IGQAIETLGEPTYVSGTDNENAQGLSPEQASLALYYPEQQTVVYACLEAKQNRTMTEQTPVFARPYVRPQDMDEVIAGSALYNWEGYQAYAAYIDGNYDVTPEPTSDVSDEADAGDAGDTDNAADNAATEEADATAEVEADDVTEEAES